MEEELGALLGAYGSDEDHDDEDHLSHLTGSVAGLPPGREAEEAADAPKPDRSKQPVQPPHAGGAAPAPAEPPADEQPQPELQPEAAQQPLDRGDEDGAEGLPPELAQPPPGECEPGAQARVAKWLAVQARGKHLTDELRASRDYRNPQFFRKMVEYWEIEERGTALAPDVFDPAALPPEDSVEALRAEWAAEEERRRAARAAGTSRIEFTKASQQQQQQAQQQAGGLTAAQQAAVSTAVAAAQAKAAAMAAAAGARR